MKKAANRCTIVLVCLACLSIWLWIRQGRGVERRLSPAPSNESGAKERNAQLLKPHAPKATVRSIVQTIVSNTPLDPNSFQSKVPIKFYGKVVDEKGNPVAGADIGFEWQEDMRKSRKAVTQSDDRGLFSLEDAQGSILGVRVKKDDYYNPKPEVESFQYAYGEYFSADPAKPVVFKLRKRGQGSELITSQNGVRSDLAIRLPKDNTTERIDFLRKEVSPSGELEIRQMKPPWNEAKEWSFELTITDGGLQENNDEFPFEAPERDYESSIKYHFTKSETNWVTHVTKQFYFVFGIPKKYGWLRVESDLDQETVFLTYAINPSGSRDLESKAEQPKSGPPPE